MQKIIKWFKNYWYYYKWYVLISLFVIAVITVCIVQCSVKDDFDIYITYAGPDNISNQIEDVRSAVRASFTGKEQKEADGISVRDIIWINSELAAQYRRDDIYYDQMTNNNNAELLYTEAASGDSFIYILDKQQYERLREDGVFAPLSKIFGDSIPDCAYDEYGIDFKKTSFAQFFDCFKEWRGELVLCIRSGDLSKSLINRIKGSASYEKAYELHKKVFTDIVNFNVE